MYIQLYYQEEMRGGGDFLCVYKVCVFVIILQIYPGILGVWMGFFQKRVMDRSIKLLFCYGVLHFLPRGRGALE